MIVVSLSFFVVSGSTDWINNPDYLPDLGPILDDVTLGCSVPDHWDGAVVLASSESEFTTRHKTILSNVLFALPRRSLPHAVFERCSEAFKAENLPLIGFESFTDHMKRFRREMVENESRSSSSVQVLPSQSEVFEELRNCYLIFDHAIEEIERKFDERHIPRMTRRKARRVWNALGLGLRSSALTTEHILIIKKIVIERGLKFYDNEDKREKYKEACRLFSEAGLSPVSVRMFLQQCKKTNFSFPLPRYSVRHKEIARNVVTKYGDQSWEKIHSIALQKFKSENLRPVPLSTFRSWNRILPMPPLSSPHVAIHNSTTSISDY